MCQWVYSTCFGSRHLDGFTDVIETRVLKISESTPLRIACLIYLRNGILMTR